MSERLKSTNQYSNEDIIEDLTKDLKKSLSTEDPPETFVINPDSKAEDFPSCSGDAHIPTMAQDIPTVDDGSDFDLQNMIDDHDNKEAHDGKKEDENEKFDSDSIDEESLKVKEVDLTDDEKAERRIIAEDLKSQGNVAFKDGEYERSIEKYTEGLKTCPLQFTELRAVLYCNRSAAKMKLNRYPEAIKDCTKAIQLDDKYVKAYLRRAQSYEATDKLDESLADYKKLLELDPSHKEAFRATIRLPPIIAEKTEKLKEEMLGKLKDFGNMILKPFGLSTENFKLEQDPETKGYKINYQQ